jgi:hypothetical protein
MNKEYIKYIQEKLLDNFDVKYRLVQCSQGVINIVFIDDLCDSKFISENIVKPLMDTDKFIDIESIKNEILYANIVGNINSKEEALFHVLAGDVVIVSDFLNIVFFCEAKGFAKRNISIPPTEAVIKGPREGFTEVLVDNVAMIRRKVKNENLKFESLYLGSKSNTTVSICYIKDTAPSNLVKYITDKVKNMDYDFILGTNYVDEQIKTNKSSFETIGYTEKPDIAVSKLFEGKVLIIVDGTPLISIAPYFFIENLQTADDYFLSKNFANVMRLYRWLAFFIAIFTPGLYIALTTYHFSLIPTIFAFRLANARAGVPFPTIVEIIIMSMLFQLLREAGIRLPQPTGQAMSIVGALILGDAAIGAGLASQSTIVIVSISAIATFLIPKLYKGILIWSYVIIIFSSLLGLPGFYLGFFLLISHLASLESCGYPYLYPLGTLEIFNFNDIFIRKNLSKISNTIFDKDED